MSVDHQIWHTARKTTVKSRKVFFCNISGWWWSHHCSCTSSCLPKEDMAILLVLSRKTMHCLESMSWARMLAGAQDQLSHGPFWLTGIKLMSLHLLVGDIDSYFPEVLSPITSLVIGKSRLSSGSYWMVRFARTVMVLPHACLKPSTNSNEMAKKAQVDPAFSHLLGLWNHRQSLHGFPWCCPPN